MQQANCTSPLLKPQPQLYHPLGSTDHSEEYSLDYRPRYDPHHSSEYQLQYAPQFHSDGPTPRPGSPTPSELEEVNQPIIPNDWYKQPKYIVGAIVVLILIVFSIMVSVFHDKINVALAPAGRWLTSHKFGWLIPVAILVVLSFPPLFGQEIVAILIGDFYSLWAGFGIMALGTLIGEILNYFVFKTLCFSRGRKTEESNLFYASFARAVREGGFLLAVMARYSAIPPHYTTTAFATVGMPFFIFLAAAVLSLPKQFASIAVGSLLSSSSSSSSTDSKHSKTLSTVVLVVSIVVTYIATKYILAKIQAQKLHVVREWRRKKFSPSL